METEFLDGDGESYRWLSPNEHDRAGRDLARYFSGKVKRVLESDLGNLDIILQTKNDVQNLMHIVDKLGIPVEPVDYDDPQYQLGTKYIDAMNRYVTAVEDFIPLENEVQLPPEA